MMGHHMFARLRQLAAVAVLTLAGLCVLVLTAPAAGAASVVRVAGRVDESTTSKTVALASTGLNITTPIIVGLVMLVVGILLVCWAFLRRGHPRHDH